VVVQVHNSHEVIVVLLRVLNRRGEQVSEPLQRVLIHGINDGQIDNREEENLGAVGNGPEVLTRLVNLFLSDSSLSLSDLDIVRGNLGVIKHVDERVIFKDLLDLRVLGQVVQDLLFNLSQSLGSLRILLHNSVLLLLEVGHLLHHKLIEHLLLQSLRRDSKVKNGDLNLGFGRVGRVRKSSGHEESEVMVVRD